jgi:hypothetical protein
MSRRTNRLIHELQRLYERTLPAGGVILRRHAQQNSRNLDAILSPTTAQRTYYEQDAYDNLQMWSRRLPNVVLDSADAILLSALTSRVSNVSSFLTMVRLLTTHAVDSLRFKSSIEGIPFDTDVVDALLEWADSLDCKDVAETLSERVGDGHWLEPVTDDEVTRYSIDPWFCSDCGYSHSHLTNQETLVSRIDRFGRSNDVVFSCSLSNAFYCDVSDAYYWGDAFSASDTADGDIICHEWAHAHPHWRFNDHTDRWHCTDDDDGGDGDGDDTAGVPAYHGANRFMTNDVQNSMVRADASAVTMADRRFGLEVEMHLPTPNARRDFYNEVVRANADICYAESDGSLDDYCGLEVISVPICYSAWVEGNKFQDVIETARKGYEATAWSRRAEYGVHVNMDLRGVSDMHQNMMFVAVNSMPTLYCLVSGREPWNGVYRKFKRSDVNSRHAFVSEQFARHNTNVGMFEKYQPVRLRERNNESLVWAEFRMFGSNLRKGALLEYIDMCHATLEWCRSIDTDAPFDADGNAPCMAVFDDNATEHFLKWLFTVPHFQALKAMLERFNVSPNNIPSFTIRTN